MEGINIIVVPYIVHRTIFFKIIYLFMNACIIPMQALVGRLVLGSAGVEFVISCRDPIWSAAVGVLNDEGGFFVPAGCPDITVKGYSID